MHLKKRYGIILKLRSYKVPYHDSKVIYYRHITESPENRTVDQLCDRWSEYNRRRDEICHEMSAVYSQSFYLTVLAYESYVNGQLEASGHNLMGIEEPCLTLPRRGEPPKACRFPFVAGGTTYSHCSWSGNGQVHWCPTEIDQNGTAVHRGNCGPRCPLPQSNGKEERCMTDKREPCLFPFIFNNVTYSSCTWDYSNTPWCSTRVDSSGVHIGGAKGTCGGRLAHLRRDRAAQTLDRPGNCR